MNFAYFRKSTHTAEETAQNVVLQGEQRGWKVLARHPLPDNMGEMVMVCRPEWLQAVASKEHQLLGFLPCSITVLEKDGQVLVGTGQIAVIKALAQSQEVVSLAAQAEGEIKELIHAAAGVGELVAKNIKLYSTTSCPYCKMEKSWLDSKNVSHEMVLVDMNPAEAEALVKKTGQMGVPVTEIQYEDAEPEYIVGFDRTRLAQALGVAE